MPESTSELMPIRTVAALTGVNAMTLRTWERRYRLIEPRRTPTGHRLYSQSHVDDIRRVVALVDRGVPISRVRDVLQSEKPRGVRTDARWQKFLHDMLAGISLFDEREIDRIYDDALSLHSLGSVTRNLILPLLAALGTRWRTIDGAIAEEHFFATYLRSKLGARLQHRIRYADGPRLLAACIPGEHHEIGLLLFGLAAHEAGLHALLLGADTPLEELVHAQRRAASNAIVLSTSIDPSPEFLGHHLPNLVRSLDVPVYIGGAISQKNRKDIVNAGAIALGSDIEDGIRIIASRLIRKGESK